MTQLATYERDLTESEIEERRALHLQLAQRIAENVGSVDSKRKEIRMLNQARKKLDIRSSDLLRELRTGKVFEGAQTSLAIDLSVPDPFAARYPMARDHEHLHAEISVVLQGVLVPSIEKLERWHASSPEFHAIANWSRTELAYMNEKEHPELELAPRLPMPQPLFDLRVYIGQQSRPRKQPASKPAKPRPARGTPTRKQPARRRK
jgi:hypothetical protein